MCDMVLGGCDRGWCVCDMMLLEVVTLSRRLVGIRC